MYCHNQQFQFLKYQIIWTCLKIFLMSVYIYIFVHLCLSQRCSRWPRGGSIPSVHPWTMGKYNRYSASLSMQVHIVQPLMGRAFWHMLQRGWTWGCDAELRKPDVKWPTLFDSTCMRSLEQSHSQRQRRGWLPAAGHWRQWRCCLTRTVPVSWRVLRVDGRDGCTTLWMYLVPLNCTHT